MSEYNVITSPQQESAAATDNEQTPTAPMPEAAPSPSGPMPSAPPSGAMPQSGTQKPLFQPQNMPMRRIMDAVMRGAARVQGQEQAKKVATDQAASKGKVKVTMEQNPTGGEPLITVNKAPASMFMGPGAQEAQVAQAYNQPMQQAEAKIAQSNQQPQDATADMLAQSGATETSGPPELPPDIPLSHITTPPKDEAHPIELVAQEIDDATGQHTPRPWEIDPEKLKSEAGIRDLIRSDGWGDPDAVAHATWKDLQSGKSTPQSVARNIANKRLANIHAQAQQIDQATLLQRQQAAQKKSEAAADIANRRLTDQEIAAQNKEKLDFIRTTDLSLVDPKDLEATVQAGTNAPWTPSDLNRAKLKQKQDVNKAFEDFTGNPERHALGNYQTWDEAKQAFGHPLTPEQDAVGQNRWAAARKFELRKQADDAAQQQLRAARLENIQMRIENAQKTKPESLKPSDISIMDSNYLANANPDSIKDYPSVLAQKEGQLRKEIADQQRIQRKASSKALAIQGKPEYLRGFGDAADLAGNQADAQSAMSRIKQANDELAIITQRRASLKAPAPTAPAATAPAAITPPKGAVVGTIHLKNGTAVRGWQAGGHFYNGQTGVLIQ